MHDVTPDAVDWPDFQDVSAAEAITGIDEAIMLDVTASAVTGAPVAELRVNGGAWQPLAPVAIAAGDLLQFHVSGQRGGESAHFVIANTSDGDATLDEVVGTASPPITGTGTLADPYTATTPPVSCAAFLAAFPGQDHKDGSYALASFVAYCDMSTDGDGWTLVARVLGTSTTHVTASAVGTLTDPAQATTAKLADAAIDALAFSHARIAIENVGTVYATVTSLDLSGSKEFSLLDTSAPDYAGPYANEFLTQVSCNSDCGVAVARPNMGFGNNCGYDYFASANNATSGMGCQGNHSKPGTVWVQ